ncbi:hypothetical protein MMC13_006309 [Lambiella insularis]|nr:hypothetical protein [Lambiella insularis]
MARQYSPAELLHLRGSPLVCKPVGLADVEQWMESQPAPNQRKPATNRAKPEDSSYTDIAGPRPSLYEARHLSRSSATVPSEIILGPPKTTFASASSARNPKTFDSPFRTTFGSTNGDPTRNDHYNSKDKTRDKDKVTGEDQRPREPRSAALYGRIREEGDSWSGLRSGKNLPVDEADRPYRRNGDREGGHPKGENGDSKRSQRGFENHRRDLKGEGDDAGTSRRNGNERGNRQSWSRDDEAHDGQAIENNRETTKRGDWRDNERSNRRGADRDWNRGGKVEQDPEWMLEPDIEEKKQTRTVDDIEQWKASMRAGKGTAEAGAVPTSGITKKDLVPAVGAKLDTPLGLDPTFDKFFGLWPEHTPGHGAAKLQISEDHLKSDAGRSQAPKSSRFTGFFSPKPDIPPQETEPPPSSQPAEPEPREPNSSNEDREGFQRILQMLGGGNVLQSPALQSPMDPSLNNSQSNAQPQNTQLLKAFREVPSRPPRHNKTPSSIQPTTTASASPPILSPRSRRSITLENLLGPLAQTPQESHPTQNSESEFLLSLMRPKGVEVKQVAASNQRALPSNAPGILPHPNLMSQSMNAPHQPHQPHQSHQSHQPLEHGGQYNFYDESPAESTVSRDKLNPTSQRRSTRTSVPGPFDDFSEPPPTRQRQMPLPSHFSLPPGLQRPPGFDQLPPGFNPNLQQQRQSMVVPPPGFQQQNPNSARNPNQFPPGLIPNLANLNISPDRGLPPFAMRPMGPGPGAPAPPPGFMSMGGPAPPGFPPLQDEAARMMFGGGMPRGNPMDMYGDMNGFGSPTGNGAGRGGFGR